MTERLPEKPTIAVLGTGALGGLYGGLLAKAGEDVHFLARSDFEHLRKNGLQVETPLGDFHLKSPQVYDSAQAMPPADLVIVAWKATANEALGIALKEICGPNTLVLVLQNGWEVEAEAARMLDSTRVLGGCCFLCSNKVGPGHIKHLDFGRIAFGEYAPDLSGEITPRMEQLTTIFRNAAIDMQPSTNLRAVRWKKLVWNIPFNGLSVVLDSDTKQIMEDPEASRLTEAIMQEVRAAANACGFTIEQEHLQKMLDDTRRMVPYDSSMLLDYRAKRPMEVEAIFGNPLRAAGRAGLKLPKIEMLYQQLCFIDRQNQAK